MNSKLKLIILSFLIIIWMFLIFFLSDMDSRKSNSDSKGTIIKVIEVVDDTVVNVGLKDNPINKEKKIKIANNLNVPLRKLAHFSEYLVLALLLINAVKLSNIKCNKYIVVGIFCLVYASSDEIHQMFTGRTSSVIDVLIDFSGALVGMIIYYGYNKLRLKRVNR